MSDVYIRDIDESDIVTILADDIEFTGTLSFPDSLMIKGKMEGEISATGDLYIDKDAYVAARVEANLVSIKGHVKGDVFAHAKVELYSTAMVEGDITAPDVIMESGCRFNGICRMEAPPEHPAPGSGSSEGER
jgi:cytoskeletal protein CcmA (bactofilin family)